ncbi:MAG: hypothetical protein M0024_09685 [Nitrospiraceae bacterium]|nr:hypothetical protein [Nitrospiraceae bacterium]
MSSNCGICRHGHDTKPDGQKPSPGTVWCGQRKIQMAKHRQMPCFVSLPGMKIGHCVDCRRARITKPTGGSPQLGNVWCEKKHLEINKQRSMECFE